MTKLAPADEFGDPGGAKNLEEIVESLRDLAVSDVKLRRVPVLVRYVKDADPLPVAQDHEWHVDSRIRGIAPGLAQMPRRRKDRR